MKNNISEHTGGCLCGAVRYRVSGALRGVVNCHCSQCQKLNGNFGAHSKAANVDLEIVRSEGLAWFQISRSARRGFCSRCGSGLFWQLQGQDATGIIAGSLDEPGELRTIGHIFVAEKPAYTEICDDLPRFDASSDGQLPGDAVTPDG